MDQINYPPYSTNYDYSQIHQGDGQHVSHPDTEQTSHGRLASGASGSHSAPYLNPNTPGMELEYLLRTPQPTTLDEITQPEAGQMSAGSGTLGQAYWNPYTPALIPPSPGADLEYLLRTLQPSTLDEFIQPSSQPVAMANIIQNNAPAEPSNPHPDAPRGEPTVKERFMAGLEAFGRGVPVKKCSPTIYFADYINTNGHMVKYGISLYNKLTEAEKTLLKEAVIARKAGKMDQLAGKETTRERFLAGLDNYARGDRLVNCSATIGFRRYVTDDGHLHKAGEDLCASLSAEDQERVNWALTARSRWAAANEPVEKRFLAGLDLYAQGVPLADCSATLIYRNYVSDNGHLQPHGQIVFDSLSTEDQERVNQALISRFNFYYAQLATNDTVQERFLAVLDDYAEGVPLAKCSRDIHLSLYITDDGHLRPNKGRPLYNKLSPADKTLVDQALAAREQIFTQRVAKEMDQFMATLEPYANGQPLTKCGNQSGLKKKVITYLSPEGGLRPRGKQLMEKMQPDQQDRVLDAIARRQRCAKPNPPVPESSRQWPEMPSSMPEMSGINQAPMADPSQMENMSFSVWPLTDQTVQGAWGIPSESAEPHIDYFGSDAVGENFQHQYGPNGLMPQSAPGLLIGRGITHGTLINILGEVYQVQYTGRLEPTNENPYCQGFMLMPYMWGS
jgi:hypothetical protein